MNMTIRRIGATLLSLAVVVAACSSLPAEPAEGPTPDSVPTRSDPNDPSDSADSSDTDPVISYPRTGVSWRWTNEDIYADYLTQLDGASTWIEVEWCISEPEPGTFNWNPLDRNIERSQRFGIETQLRLRVGSCWATGGAAGEARGALGHTASIPPLDMAEYERWVAQVAEHTAAIDIRSVTIENEPNVVEFWAGTPAELDAFIRAAAPIVRKHFPGVPLLDPGVSSSGVGFALAEYTMEKDGAAEAMKVYNQFFERRQVDAPPQRVPQVRTSEDLVVTRSNQYYERGVAFTDVAIGLSRDGITDGFQLHLYDGPSNVEPVLAMIREQLGDDIAIEAWEVGLLWPGGSDDPSVQAGEVAVLMAELFVGGVRSATFLPVAWGNEGENERRIGLLDVDPSGAERPAAGVIKAMLDLDTGPTFSQWRKRSSGSATVWVGHNGASSLIVAENITVSADTLSGLGTSPTFYTGRPDGQLDQAGRVVFSVESVQTHDEVFDVLLP